MEFVEQFDREIQGEKLLYLNKEEYTEEECKLIVETLAKRMSKNCYFASLVSKFKPILKEKIWPKLKEYELFREKDAIGYEFERISGLSANYAEEEYDFACYNAKLEAGIGFSKNYFDVIKNANISGKKLCSILDDEVFSFVYDIDVDYLITANMMFKRYPEFYDEERLSSLSTLIFYNDKKEMNKEELKEYRVAEKLALKNIKKLNKKFKNENKIKRKTWREANK